MFRLFGYGLLATIVMLVPVFPATSVVREKTWGEPVTEEKMRVDDHGKTWQVMIRFDRGGVFGIDVEKTTGRVLVPVD